MIRITAHAANVLNGQVTIDELDETGRDVKQFIDFHALDVMATSFQYEDRNRSLTFYMSNGLVIVATEDLGSQDLLTINGEIWRYRNERTA